MSHSDYIHGYSKEEQQRLIKQAEFLKPYIFEDVQMSSIEHLLEVGCGVGAQTKIMLEIFPQLKITCIDLSKEQLALAEQRLVDYIDQGRVTLIQSNAAQMDELPNAHFDGAFLCWFLEHVPQPVKVLEETRKKLKPRAPLWSSEVMNWSFFVDPYCHYLLKYWFEFNDYQWSIQGHPFVGAQMGNHLTAAGFHQVQTDVRTWLWDDRYPVQRKEFFDEFKDLLYSAAGELKKAGRVDQELIDNMKREFDERRLNPGSVFYFSWMRATALCP